MENSKRLMWNIFIFMIGFCTFLLLVLWLLQTSLLGKMYESIRKREIGKAIILVEDNINNPELDYMLRDLAENQEILVTPLQEFIPPDRPAPRDKPPIREAIMETREFTTADGKTLSFVFYAIISPVNATISTIKIQLYYVTIIMLVLSVALSLIIARMVARPIESLNEKAKLLAKGDYEILFTGRGYKEIHELSDTLNHTAVELAKVDQLRRELMANISHDLRTPLALIYGYAEMMHDFPEEISQEQTRLIMAETQRLSFLVNDILDVSSLENKAMELNLTRFSLTGSINQTVARLAELVSKDGYKFIFEPLEEIFVKADELKINQVFYNLLVNAIHYSPSDQPITIRQSSTASLVRIEVADHGQGIKQELIPYIWDRYYKAGERHKRAIAGTGLGLSIVKKIIELHGGTYGVESQTGIGSTFWFQIERI